MSKIAPIQFAQAITRFLMSFSDLFRRVSIPGRPKTRPMNLSLSWQVRLLVFISSVVRPDTPFVLVDLQRVANSLSNCSGPLEIQFADCLREKEFGS